MFLPIFWFSRGGHVKIDPKSPLFLTVFFTFHSYRPFFLTPKWPQNRPKTHQTIDFDQNDDFIHNPFLITNNLRRKLFLFINSSSCFIPEQEWLKKKTFLFINSSSRFIPEQEWLKKTNFNFLHFKKNIFKFLKNSPFLICVSSFLTKKICLERRIAASNWRSHLLKIF